MAPRLQLQSLLETICPRVYFQPPTNLKMEYPCIVYKRDSAQTDYADNHPYRYLKRYLVTIIDRNPDSELPDQVALLSTSGFNRHYTADNLNHDVFTLFF